MTTSWSEQNSPGQKVLEPNPHLKPRFRLALRRQVLHVVGGLDSKGGVSHFVRDCKNLDLEGFDQVEWRHRDYATKWEGVVREGNEKFTDMGMLPDLIGAWKDLIPLWRWCRKAKPAVLHVHSRMGLGTACLLRKVTKCHVPMVIHVHSMWKRVSFYRSIYSRHENVTLFNSPKTCVHFGFIPSAKNIFTPFIQWPGEAPGGVSEKVRFVTCGSFVRLKKFDLVVSAFEEVHKAAPNSELHMFGVSDLGPEMDYQKEVIDQAKNLPGIYFHDYDPNWTHQLNSNDIFVHAAEKESFGIVMLEAFARGLRIVAPPGSFLSSPEFDKRLGVTTLPEITRQFLATQMLSTLQISKMNWYHERVKFKREFSSEGARVRLKNIYAAL